MINNNIIKAWKIYKDKRNFGLYDVYEDLLIDCIRYLLAELRKTEWEHDHLNWERDCPDIRHKWSMQDWLKEAEKELNEAFIELDG